jgi:hypothetical protein
VAFGSPFERRRGGVRQRSPGSDGSGTPAGGEASEDPGQPGPRQYHGQYAIYKPTRSGKGGVLRFELSPERSAVFVEGAHQAEGELRRFAWQKKIVMKWGLSDIGEALAVIERRQPEARLFHQTARGSTAFELRHQTDRQPPNFFATISRQKADTKDVDRLGVSVSPGEASVLAALLRQAAVVLSGWGGAGRR